ncbi:hypothetical protein [Vibrio vulnificus YJ016]|uniref:Uncharacterized protein n=1 Tax=Vibrio vulnificus (strain YJ016) TaxID=196600 RepID=Q7MNT4_VIBVY|nr:hypothetical protein [Vibrio vulnificus YJ016]
MLADFIGQRHASLAFALAAESLLAKVNYLFPLVINHYVTRRH